MAQTAPSTPPPTMAANALTDPRAEAALASYGDRAVALEPGGVEWIPDAARHGRPRQMFWTWTSPNLEFATVAVGILGPLYWGLSLTQAVLAIVAGTALGSLSHGVLSTWGPRAGLSQMVLSRSAFGFLGNILPAGLNSVVAGVGWFAVNSISGALALAALVPAVPRGVWLVVVVAVQLGVALAGHNLVHAFERLVFPVLAVIFAVAVVIVFSKSHPSAPGTGGLPTSGGFLLAMGASFGYAAGWNPYASDYTRYLPASTPRRRVGLYAALGIFVSCVVLESAGAAMVSAVGAKAGVDPGVFTGLLPTWLGKLTLLGIAVGAVAANALNVYSGSLSFMALGVRLPTGSGRAVVAAVFGLLGLAVAFAGLGNAGASFEAFLLVIAYWIGPWLGVVFADRFLRRGARTPDLLGDRTYTCWAGPVAMVFGMVVSIVLFSNQTNFVGLVATHVPALGDIAFEVGFVLAAAAYAVGLRLLPPRSATGLVPLTAV
ncbi:MAG: cytosine permease [Mycobacteriaceae bacterium]